MAVEKDKHIDPELKARWGFGGTAGNITVGPETVGETGGVDHARTRIEESGGRNNGGGADDSEALRAQLADMQGKNSDLQSQLDQSQADLADSRKPVPVDGSADTAALDDLTIPQIKEQLDAKSIQYKASDAKPELLAALKAAQ